MIVNREEFLKQLESVLPGLSTKDIIEQSSCFIFKDGRVHTYNDEIACSQKSALKIEGAIPATPLISILRKLSEDELEITTGENDTGATLLIKGKRRHAGINMEQDILLPVEAVDKPKKWKNLPANFADAVSIVCPCAGTNETQFILTCVNITSKWIEASDMYHGARYKIKTDVDKPLLIRRDSLKSIISLGMVKFSETKHWIHFKNSDGLILSCRHWMDDYVSDDLTEILKSKGRPLALPKGLRDAVEKAQIFSAENPENSNVIVNLKSGKFKITGQGASGWFTEVKKSKYNGPSLQFTIPPKLLVELVQNYNQCEVSENLLKVSGEKFKYATVLGKVGEK